MVLLVDLSQCGLGEGAAGAEEGDEPHPDDGPRAAEGDGGGHADDVARADTSGECHGEGLEGGDAGLFFLAAVTAEEEAEHLAEATHLDKAGAQGEVESGGEAERDERRTPDPVVDRQDGTGEPVVEGVHDAGVFRQGFSRGTVGVL